LYIDAFPFILEQSFLRLIQGELHKFIKEIRIRKRNFLVDFWSCWSPFSFRPHL